MLDDFDLTKANQNREKTDAILNGCIREMLFDEMVSVNSGMLPCYLHGSQRPVDLTEF
jgi:hypothetical protein